MGAEKPGAPEIVELLLTAEIFNRTESLTEEDLPPKIRDHFAHPGTGAVAKPLEVTIADVEKICGRDHIEGTIAAYPFVIREPDDDRFELAFELAAGWFAIQETYYDTVKVNPVLAHYYQKDDPNVSYTEVKWPKRTVNTIVTRIEKLHGDEADDLQKLVTIKIPEEVRNSLDDLVLTEDQKTEIAKAGKALEHRKYLKEIGLTEIGKILFVGPPGTGKTSSARALSRWFSLPLLEVRLSTIISKYLGETSKNIDSVFMLAKSLHPCILFIDEFDFVAKTRTSDDHGAIKRAVNTLLKAVDEVSLVEDGVLLIAATNYPQLLDYAAWRRFDKVLGFSLPDEEMRCKILEKVLRRMDADVDYAGLARLTEGYSGSDIRLVIREAVLNALLEDRKKIDQQDLLRAVEDFERRMSDHRRERAPDSAVSEDGRTLMPGWNPTE